ncbi:MAG: hypothetical protein RhofKO_41660 [Rhodothermales bacterium]
MYAVTSNPSAYGSAFMSAIQRFSVPLITTVLLALSWASSGHVVCAQGAAVNSVQFSPDGTRLASANSANQVIIWDALTGRRLMVFPALDAYIVFVAWSPDGSMLATASYDNVIRLWDAASGALRTQLTGHTDVPFYAHFSPDGRHLATAAQGAEVIVWDVAAGTTRQSVLPPGDIATSARFSPDGQALLTAGRGEQIHLWDWASQSKSASLMVGGKTLTTALFSRDGRQVAGGGSAGVIKIFEVANGDELESYDHGVYSNSFILTNEIVASAGGDGTLRVWSRENGREKYTREAHRSIAFFVTASPDGKTLATVGQDTLIRLWDAASGVLLRTISGR